MADWTYPAWLSDDGEDLWKETLTALEARGLLPETSPEMAAHFVQLLLQFRFATRDVQEFGQWSDTQLSGPLKAQLGLQDKLQKLFKLLRLHEPVIETQADSGTAAMGELGRWLEAAGRGGQHLN